jgi:hypothetical protein
MKEAVCCDSDKCGVHSFVDLAKCSGATMGPKGHHVVATEVLLMQRYWYIECNIFCCNCDNGCRKERRVVDEEVTPPKAAECCPNIGWPSYVYSNP